MRIVLIGWYGTETIGDRAILAGILSLFSDCFRSYEIHLGSLYPFMSARTLVEDDSLWQKIIGRKIRIKIFNTMNHSELDAEIRNADMLAMGGGPLMHINPIYMIEYAIKKAKKAGVKSVILGAGVGPLSGKIYTQSVVNIINHADRVFLRDSISKKVFEDICREYKLKINNNNIFISLDPSVECAMRYELISPMKKSDYIAINYRSFPLEYSKLRPAINEHLKAIVRAIGEKYPEKQIRLIPMHYFHIGNDDRIILNEISHDIRLENVTVNNIPASLASTMDIFKDAYLNIGMRFHSVVLQTLLSGKNIILDYTEPGKGKISGFIKEIDDKNIYSNRYFNLMDTLMIDDIIHTKINRFYPDKRLLKEKMDIYRIELRKLMA